MDRLRGLHALVAIAAVIVTACGASDPTARPTSTSAAVDPATSPSASELMGLIATPIASPSTTPTLAPTATPTPTPKPASRWSKPSQIGTIKGCSTLTSGIDGASRYHVAAECSGSVDYFVSSNAGRSWTHTHFAHPARRQDLDPQIAFWGDTVYLAYSRIAVGDGGCGSDGTIDVGVYVRSRNKPDGTWSLPVRIGSPNDRLDTFRVERQTIHAVVNGGTYYETQDGPTLHRYPIPHAMPVGEDQHGPFGRSSLRVGSDGRARILYETGSGLRYGVFTGAGFSTSRIPGTTERDRAPLLVLGAGDQPHLLWTRLPVPPSGGGCAGDEPRPKDHGALYATNTSGTWKVSRVTPDVGETSLQVDERTGTIHVLVSARSVLKHYTRAAGGSWRGSRVTSASMTSPLLRLDPATGGLLVVYLGGPDGSRIYDLTKP